MFCFTVYVACEQPRRPAGVRSGIMWSVGRGSHISQVAAKTISNTPVSRKAVVDFHLLHVLVTMVYISFRVV